MANYQIKLTPVETFFFGGEKHSLNAKGELVSDYFSESNLYPQQTTLLGLVRYLLLVKNDSVFKDNKIIDKDSASILIGEKSFNFSDKKNDYGKIKNVSSLYFSFGSSNYFFAPVDYGCDLTDDWVLTKADDKELKAYTSKLRPEFIRENIISNDGDVRNLQSIISDFSVVGNEKGEKGESKEDALYKQKMKYLAPGWSFAIDVDLDDDAGVPDNDVLFLPFGGEKCFFKIEINKKQKFKPSVGTQFKRKPLAIICISDAFLKHTFLLQEADFGITDFVSFRNLKSEIKNTQKYSGLSKTDPGQLRAGNRYNLLKRGSVLYFNSEENFNVVKEAIADQLNLTNIGFNHILTINK